MNRLRAIWSLIKKTIEDWQNDNAFRLAAALAYYAIFSLAPIIIILVGVASLFLEQAEARQRILEQIETLMGPQSGAAIQELPLTTGSSSYGMWAIAIGSLTAIIAATGVFGELQADLNQIWDVRVAPDRQGILEMLRARLAGFCLVLIIALLLFLSFILSAVLTGVAAYTPGIPWFWQGANLLISFVVSSLLFAAIYKYLPDVKLTWKDVLVGAAVTALLFTLGKHLVGLYLGRMAIMNRYGAAGAFVLLLLWIYYVSLIFLLGAEFAQVYTRRYGAGIQPRERAIRRGEKPDAI